MGIFSNMFKPKSKEAQLKKLQEELDELNK